MGKINWVKGKENMKTANKTMIVEQLKKTPIIQIACEKLGVSRATFYRWKTRDKVFAEKVEKAINDGSLLVNDMAESQLISAIKNNNLTAIFWLKTHHTRYSPKLEVTTKDGDLPLNDEQKELIKRSLNFAFSNTSLMVNTDGNTDKQ